ncbi:hypothetical protein ACVWXQ_001836 [Bradyrhizobium sp. S3.14.4]
MTVIDARRTFAVRRAEAKSAADRADMKRQYEQQLMFHTIDRVAEQFLRDGQPVDEIAITLLAVACFYAGEGTEQQRAEFRRAQGRMSKYERERERKNRERK